MSDTPIRVLLVEDNPGDARLIQEVLVRGDRGWFDLEHAARLSEAQHILAHGEFDVVLLDLSLPDSRGIETVIALRRDSMDVPIIVLSGLDDQDIALEAVRNGAQDYLVKGAVDGELIARAIRYSIQRHRGEQELQASRASFSNIVDKNGDGVVVADETGVVLFANTAWCQFSGVEADQLIGEVVPFALVPETVSEIDVVREDQSPGKGEVLVVSTEWQGRGAFLLTLRDVTERKRAEEALRQSEKLSSLGQLVAGVAHELNNPLYSIYGLSKLAMDGDLDETLKKELGMIHSEAERAVRIVQDLLSFARRNGPGMEYTSINDAIGAAVELRRYELSVTGIELETYFQPDLPLLMIDTQQVQQVALNLIVNAEHAMLEANDGGRLLIKTEKVGHAVHFVVSDNGPGIPLESIGKVFDPFFTTKEVGKGTGLGLSICYGIIQEHGGDIRAENQAPNGATFTVELPIPDQSSALSGDAEEGNRRQENRAVSSPLS